jgi:outer membrane protein
VHRLGLVIVVALATGSAQAAPRALTLADAVELAMRTDPLIAEARIQEDRSKLAVLRSQLDRVSLKIDGTLQELFSKSNIGGPPLQIPRCALPNGATISADADTCVALGGSPSLATLADQQPQSGVGILNLSANLNVPIFSGLRVESNVKRQQTLRDASTVSIRQQRRDLALSVARSYWQVRRVALLYDVESAALERLRMAETVADGRVKAGLAPPIDRNRAQVRRLNSTANAADLAGQMREAAVTLGVALGIPDELVLTDVPMVPDAPPPPVEVLLSDAKGGRPELKIADLQVEAQHQAVRMAASGFYPQLSAFGLFQLGNNAFNPAVGARQVSGGTNPFSNISGNLTLGVTLNMNFFDTLNTWTLHRDARFEHARLLEERRRFGRVIDADVRAAHARVQKLFARRLPLVAARDVALDNVKILEARYKNGDALVIEFLEAQNDLTNAERALTDVQAQLQLAWLELDASLGNIVGARP